MTNRNWEDEIDFDRIRSTRELSHIKNKLELQTIFWSTVGLSRFRENGPFWIEVSSMPPRPPFKFPLAEDYEYTKPNTLLFELCFISIASETWAYVRANDIVVVPPFEFVGWEFMPNCRW